MPADPVTAGRKGGQSRSEKKLAACRRNGFQKRQIPALVPARVLVAKRDVQTTDAR